MHAPLGRWFNVVAIAVAIAGAAYALAPLVHFVRRWNDFAFVYAAGRTWLAGGSPYDYPVWSEHWRDIHPSFAGLTAGQVQAPPQPYLYPPHWAVLAVPLALLPWSVAMRVWDLVNILCFAGILAFSISLLTPKVSAPARQPWVWLCIGIASLNGGVRWTIWECQLTMLAALGVVGAYWAWSRGRQGLLILFACIALLKPQIGLLPLGYLALIGGMRGVVIGGAIASVLSVLAISHLDWSLLDDQIRDCVAMHMGIPYNKPHAFFGLSSLLAPLGRLHFPVAVLGVALLAALATLRTKLKARSPENVPSALAELSLAFSINVAFIPLHGYDLLIFTPIIIGAVVVKPRWLGVSMCVLAAAASRLHLSDVWDQHLPVGPWVTLTIAAMCGAAWWLELRGDQVRQPETRIA